MKNIVVLSLVAVVLTGCVSSQGYFYEKRSGKRVDASPTILARFEEHKLQCDAEASKAALSATEPSLSKRNQLINLIYHACMAKRGYVVRDT